MSLRNKYYLLVHQLFQMNFQGSHMGVITCESSISVLLTLFCFPLLAFYSKHVHLPSYTTIPEETTWLEPKIFSLSVFSFTFETEWKRIKKKNL